MLNKRMQSKNYKYKYYGMMYIIVIIIIIVIIEWILCNFDSWTEL